MSLVCLFLELVLLGRDEGHDLILVLVVLGLHLFVLILKDEVAPSTISLKVVLTFSRAQELWCNHQPLSVVFELRFHTCLRLGAYPNCQSF